MQYRASASLALESKTNATEMNGITEEGGGWSYNGGDDSERRKNKIKTAQIMRINERKNRTHANTTHRLDLNLCVFAFLTVVKHWKTHCGECTSTTRYGCTLKPDGARCERARHSADRDTATGEERDAAHLCVRSDPKEDKAMYNGGVLTVS